MSLFYLRLMQPRSVVLLVGSEDEKKEVEAIVRTEWKELIVVEIEV